MKLFPKAEDINWGLVISLIGLGGISLASADSSLSLLAKIPLYAFFLFITMIGMALLLLPKSWRDQAFGEREGKNEFE